MAPGVRKGDEREDEKTRETENGGIKWVRYSRQAG